MLNGHAAYRTQLFLYLKACGREELSTMNLWAGGRRGYAGTGRGPRYTDCSSVRAPDRADLVSIRS